MTASTVPTSCKVDVQKATLAKHIDTDFAVANDLTPTEDVPKIVAAGSGRSFALPKIRDKVIELSGEETPNILYIGTASYDREGSLYRDQTRGFRDAGCSIEKLDVSEDRTTPDQAEMRRLVVDWADAILCSGGNTLYALVRWRKVGLDVLLAEAAEKGVVMCGGSAGGVCWFSDAHSDSMKPEGFKDPDPNMCEKKKADWDYVRINGMGIIDALVVPHYDATQSNGVPRAADAGRFVLETPDKPCIGIDENAAIVVEGDTAAVVSGDGKATVHKVVVENGDLAVNSIEPTTDEIPLDELLSLSATVPQGKDSGPPTNEHEAFLAKHVDTDFGIAKDMTTVVEDAPKIVAAGSGRSFALPKIRDKVIELSGEETPNVLYIGTASYDREGSLYRDQTRGFRDAGCTVRKLDVSEDETTPDHAEMRRLVVEWADAVLCSGGNTLYALIRWRKVGLDVLLKEAAEKGVVMCGGSAGGVCWFSDAHSDSMKPENFKQPDPDMSEKEKADWDYVRINGMGIIDAFVVPHYDATQSNGVPRSTDAERFVLETPEQPCIGIDENAAIVVQGDTAGVVSGDGIATVHKVIVENGDLSVQALEPNEEEIPLEELLSEEAT